MHAALNVEMGSDRALHRRAAIPSPRVQEVYVRWMVVICFGLVVAPPAVAQEDSDTSAADTDTDLPIIEGAGLPSEVSGDPLGCDCASAGAGPDAAWWLAFVVAGTAWTRRRATR